MRSSQSQKGKKSLFFPLRIATFTLSYTSTWVMGISNYSPALIAFLAFLFQIMINRLVVALKILFHFLLLAVTIFERSSVFAFRCCHEMNMVASFPSVLVCIDEVSFSFQIPEANMDILYHPTALVFFESWNDLNFIHECVSPHAKQYIWRNLHVKMLGLIHEEAVEEVVNQCQYNLVLFSLYRKVG